MSLICDQYKQGLANQPLIYHTFYAEYRGATAADIIAALHRDSQVGTGMNYEEWWEWQRQLWGAETIPAPDDPHACTRLLSRLNNVGALDAGPQPTGPQDKATDEGPA